MESVEMERNKVDSALCKTRVGKSGKSGKQFQATWIYYLSGQIAKPDLGKVDSYLSSETECIQKIYCRKNFTEPSLWHLTTTPERFEEAIVSWPISGWFSSFSQHFCHFSNWVWERERGLDLGKCKTPHTHEQNCSISFNTLNTFPTVSKGERGGGWHAAVSLLQLDSPHWTQYYTWSCIVVVLMNT